MRTMSTIQFRLFALARDVAALAPTQETSVTALSAHPRVAFSIAQVAQRLQLPAAHERPAKLLVGRARSDVFHKRRALICVERPLRGPRVLVRLRAWRRASRARRGPSPGCGAGAGGCRRRRSCGLRPVSAVMHAAVRVRISWPRSARARWLITLRAGADPSALAGSCIEAQPAPLLILRSSRWSRIGASVRMPQLFACLACCGQREHRYWEHCRRH